MVDAAGAIYVIGGYSFSSGTGYLHDVWASTDGGARPDSVKGGSGVLEGVLRGYSGVLRGTNGVLRGTNGVPGGT